MSEIVVRISNKSGLPKSHVTETLNTLRDVVIKGLTNGEEFELRGFGRFTTVKRKARHHVVPTRPGEVIKSKASRSVKFVPSVGALKRLPVK